MKRIINKYIINSVVIVVTLLLLTSVVWAGWSSATHLQFGVEPDQICKNGIVFGLADSDPYTYTIEFFNDPPSPNPPPSGSPVASILAVTLPGVASPVPYCSPVPTNTKGFETNFCGSIFVPWDLTPNTKLNIYIYDYEKSTPVCDADPLKDENGFARVFTVADCTVSPVLVFLPLITK